MTDINPQQKNSKANNGASNSQETLFYLWLNNGTADLSAFDDGFVVEQVGDGGAVLPHIADGEAEQFADASASGYTEHEKPAIASFIRVSGETCGHSADFVIIKRACAFQS